MEESIFGSHLGTRLRTDEEAYTSSVIARLGDLKSVLKELDRLNGTAKGPFAGRLDMSRVALAGHSLGGLTALMGSSEKFDSAQESASMPPRPNVWRR